MKKRSIVVILLTLIFLTASIGISAKSEPKKDKQDRIVIGNTYQTKLYSNVTPDFCTEANCEQYKRIFVPEDIDIDFIIVDLLEYKKKGEVISKIYKVILDPDGKKIVSYIEKDRFEIMESTQLNGTILKSEMNEGDRRKLISENEKQRIASETERQKREEKLIKQKIAEMRKKHPGWSDNTINHILKNSVHIGMTKDQAIASWGNPDSINRTITSKFIHEQWVYEGRNYLYFDNDVLTSIQN
jgi:hypothetical protein